MRRRCHSLLAVAVLAGAAPLGAQQVRVETRALPRDSAREASTQSVFLRVRTSNPEDLMLIVREMTAREERLIMELRATPPGEGLLRRRLLDDLGHLNREKFGVLSIVETRCAAESGERPAGYIGLNLESEVDGATREIRSTLVQSVDPGSPSDRAGLQPGDTLLTFGGRDVRGRKPETLASGLLEPGNRIAARVARGASRREFSLTVVPRPAGIVRTCGEFERALQPLRVATPARFMFEGTIRGEAPRRMQVEAGPAPSVGGAMQISIFGPEHLSTPSAPFFAGAQFRALDDDWRGVLNLKPDVQGVFVNEVMPGTLSAQAGLRKGDVVTNVGESPATSPMALVNLLIVTERPDATLSVLRAGEKRTLVLRLPPR